MLDRVEGVVVAVRDAASALDRYAALLGARPGDPLGSDVLAARLTPACVGTSVVLLAEPAAEGPVARHLAARGEGLFAAVLASSDVAGIAETLQRAGVRPTHDAALAEAAYGDVLVVAPEDAFGLPVIVVPPRQREYAGPISFLYEVTHLVDDWRAGAAWWSAAFGLDPDRFSEIRSERYGYEGTLTLFDPPARLDRIEVVTPGDAGAMGRFFAKRGPGAYMCYAECDDVAELKRRLDDGGARYEPSDASPAPEGLFVHPSALHGVLLGVSRTNLAWRWSGRPELAQAPA